MELEVKKAVPLLDLISPAPMVSKAADLSTSIDLATDHLAYVLHIAENGQVRPEDSIFAKLAKEMKELASKDTYTFEETQTKAPCFLTGEQIELRIAKNKKITDSYPRAKCD